MSEDIELVTVLSANDPVLIAMAKSILDDTGIKYFAKGEGFQDIFGLGRIGYNVISGPVEIQVIKDDAETAREILKELKE